MLSTGVSSSKDVLQVSVDQRVAKLQSVKVGGLKNILPFGQSRAKMRAARVRDRDDRIILQL